MRGVKRKTGDQTTELDDEQQQRAGTRGGRGNWGKTSPRGFKQPNAGVAVGGSSDGIIAADGNEGRKRKMGKIMP